MIRWLGARGALGLHLALLEDSLRLLRTAARDAGAAPFLAFSEDWEPGQESELAPLAGAAAGLPRLPQSGGDLGERLSGTFLRLTALGYRRAVVIGSDSPTLPVAILRAAFGTLRLDADVVLGPAEDGGYYLVGASRPVAELFRGIPWGTPGVLEATVAPFPQVSYRLELAESYQAARDLKRRAGRGLMSNPGTLTAALAYLPNWWQEASDAVAFDGLLVGWVRACGWRAGGFVWPLEGNPIVARALPSGALADPILPAELAEAARRVRTGEPIRRTVIEYGPPTSSPPTR